MKQFETFDEYYDVVLGNVSHSVIPDKIYYYSQQRIEEVVRKMYRFDIPYKKASVLLETFFDQFVGMISVPTNRIDVGDDTDFNYYEDNFNEEF